MLKSLFSLSRQFVKIQILISTNKKAVKSKRPMLRLRNTCQDPVAVKKFEFFVPFTKAAEHKVWRQNIDGQTKQKFLLVDIKIRIFMNWRDNKKRRFNMALL